MLKLDPNLSDPDGFYEALVAAHRGLSSPQSERVNAKLILLLANQIGDAQTLLAAIAKAREGVEPEGDDTTLAAVV